MGQDHGQPEYLPAGTVCGKCGTEYPADDNPRTEEQRITPVAEDHFSSCRCQPAVHVQQNFVPDLSILGKTGAP